jgi:hypothetical protein
MIEKKLSDHLHFYIGCEVSAPNPYEDDETILATGYLTGIHGEYGPEIQFIIDGNAEEHPEYVSFDLVKPHLRQLSDRNMTEDERREWHTRRQRKGWMPGVDADNTSWLIKQGFWLFGDDWFTEGLIIDAATVKKI